MPKITVVVPTKNEERNIARVLRLAAQYCDELIVIDGHSTDRTAALATELGAKVLYDNGRGKGAALRIGAAAATGDIIVFLDADQSHDPHDIPLLLAPILADDADHVSGSRMLGGSDELFSSPAEFVRLLGSHVITLAIGKRFGVGLTDSQNGFRAIKREVLVELDLSEDITTIEQEMVVETLRRGYRLIEVPTHEYRRKFGVSTIDVWRVAPRYVYCLLKNISKSTIKSVPPRLKRVQQKYRKTWKKAA